MTTIDQTNREILEYLKQGLTLKEIAPRVYLSYDAVNARLDKLRLSQNAKNNTELVVKYVTWQLKQAS